MAHEVLVLSDQMRSLRAALEVELLQVDQVDFVSIGFAQGVPVVLVTVGTRRPDILQVHMPAILSIILPRVAEIGCEPELQVLRGSIRTACTHITP